MEWIMRVAGCVRYIYTVKTGPVRRLCLVALWFRLQGGFGAFILVEFGAWDVRFRVVCLCLLASYQSVWGWGFMACSLVWGFVGLDIYGIRI